MSTRCDGEGVRQNCCSILLLDGQMMTPDEALVGVSPAHVRTSIKFEAAQGFQ
jgi:hypothetical protein